ncbi:MAG: phosphate signaling complex protein PhoU [Nitriliruptoraceae bacterium]
MRDELDHQLEGLLGQVVDMGRRADEMLARALQALHAGDLAAADAVTTSDRVLDRAYDQVQHGVVATIALHAPVGRDLRLATGVLHVALHTERMADYAVGVARTTLRAAEHEPDRDLLEQLIEMGELARGVGRDAMTAFVQADADLARAAARQDDAVDRLNVGIFQRLVRLAAHSEERLRWATRMIQLTRQLERYADHGVDISEQAMFVTTGQHTELSADAVSDRE